MTDTQIVVGLATIIVLGVGAQWVGRRTGIPSLLLLLPLGVLAGDVTGLVDPQGLFGDTLFPLTTLMVSLLLFQSGLGLRVAELPMAARAPVARLVSIGLAITFLGGSLAAAAVLDIEPGLAFLLGAILSVSGPTVMGPLLRVVRPTEPTGSVLRWESTALDPIGATLGVVVLNLVLASDRGGMHPALQLMGRLGVGLAVGLAVAVVLIGLLSRFWVTDDMEAAVSVMFAVAAFAVAEVLMSEAGLFSALVLGFVLANQRRVSADRMRGFGETLEVLIIGTLFILLGALVEVDALVEYALPTAALVAVLVLVVRPLSTAISLLGTSLTPRERATVGWLDPRGVVAAATAAQFAGELTSDGIDATPVLPVVFGVILGTGVIYGLTAPSVARMLGTRQPPRSGVVLVGDGDWLVDLARVLHESGVEVLLVDSRPPNSPSPVPGVRRASLPETHLTTTEALLGPQVGQALVAGRPSPALTLLMSSLVEELGRRHVHLLPHGERRVDTRPPRPLPWSERPFGEGITLQEIEDRVRRGAMVALLPSPAETAGAAGTSGDVLPLASITTDGIVSFKPSRVWRRRRMSRHPRAVRVAALVEPSRDPSQRSA